MYALTWLPCNKNAFCCSHYLNMNNKVTRGEITEEVSSTLKALWSGQYRSISCKDLKVHWLFSSRFSCEVVSNRCLKNAIGRYKSAFRGYEQQDAHEFLTIIVDWLHEELNEVFVLCLSIASFITGFVYRCAWRRHWRSKTITTFPTSKLLPWPGPTIRVRINRLSWSFSAASSDPVCGVRLAERNRSPSSHSSICLCPFRGKTSAVFRFVARIPLCYRLALPQHFAPF